MKFNGALQWPCEAQSVCKRLLCGLPLHIANPTFARHQSKFVPNAPPHSQQREGDHKHSKREVKGHAPGGFLPYQDK